MIIIVTGLPASGKSSTAKEIAKHYGYKLLSKDCIQEKLFKKYGFNNHEEKLALVKEADSILQSSIKREIKKNNSIVIDKYVRDWSYYDELFLSGYNVKCIRLDAKSSILEKRYHARNNSIESRLASRIFNVYPYIKGLSFVVPDITAKDYSWRKKNEQLSSALIPTIDINTDNFDHYQESLRKIYGFVDQKSQFKKYDFVVVGAGLSGLTIAERIANELNKKVLVIEKQKYIGGACYDSINEKGLLVSNYGPHTFHTDDSEVFEYLTKFCKWHEYYHYARSFVNGKWVSFPINKQTFKDLYDVDLSDDEMNQFIVEHNDEIIEMFFNNFTFKQWGVDRKELDPTVIARIPFRCNYDTRYFTDKYQGNPVGGYTKIFNKMIKNKNIKVVTGRDYKDVIKFIEYKKMVYTGPLDYYFNQKLGPLLYRSVKFYFETHKTNSYQPQPSSRFPGNEYPYTRITEFKKMTGQKSKYTTILKEIPCFGGIEYYPYWTKEYIELANKYRELAKLEKNTYFLGRLGEYKYYDMDDAIRSALNLFQVIKETSGE